MRTTPFASPIPAALLLALLNLPAAAADAEAGHEAFLDRVADETQALRQYRAAGVRAGQDEAPSRDDALMHEVVVQREMKRRRAAQPEDPKRPTRPSQEGLEEAARGFVDKEHHNRAQLHRERIERLLAKAAEHAERGRLDAAIRTLETVLRKDPRNERAVGELERLQFERAATEEREVTRIKERETAAAMRDVAATRIPYARTLIYARDWAERSARAEAALAEPAPDEREQGRIAVAKALETKTSIEVFETPVADVAEYLRTVTGVNFVVDDEAARATVTLNLKDVPALAVLRWTTKLTGPAHRIEPDGVYIGPPGKAAEQPVLRIYDVSHLLHVRRLLSRPHRMKTGPFLTGGADPFEHDDAKSLGEIAEELIDFIQEVTGRLRWADGAEGPHMSYRLGRLVVHAPPSLQRKVRSVLANLAD